MTQAPVVTLGDLNVDALLDVPAYPAPGGDALGTRITLQVGGSAANTAIVLSKLGLEARLIARVGSDAWAEIALGALSQAGVQADLVQRDPSASTGLCFVPVTPDGERTLFGLRGANMRLDPDAITPGALSGARWLHVSGYALLESPQREAALHAIALAEVSGAACSLDVGLVAALQEADLVRSLLPRLRVCILGLDEARAVAGTGEPDEVADALLSGGVKQVGLKLGPNGCLIATPTARVRLPGFPVAVLDTTGAGDSFGAGLIFASLHGWSLPAAGLLANALGALAATAWGGGPALPGRGDVVAFLETQTAHGAAEVLAALAGSQSSPDQN
jgi:ribokinase